MSKTGKDKLKKKKENSVTEWEGHSVHAPRDEIN